jgi:ABC transporter family protein
VFDATIRENLQLADPAAGEQELWTALAAVALDDTVAAFPAGLDTPVGPGGSALSGGQRRRLSVAQGLLRHADALLLDEPTEGLDSGNAARLLAGVRQFDLDAAIVIALHDRQSPALPWRPTAHVELAGVRSFAAYSAAIQKPPGPVRVDPRPRPRAFGAAPSGTEARGGCIDGPLPLAGDA